MAERTGIRNVGLKGESKQSDEIAVAKISQRQAMLIALGQDAGARLRAILARAARWRSGRRAARRRAAGPRRDVQVGRRKGRRPLHRQDAARGRRQGQRRAQQAGRPDQEDRQGAHPRAAARASSRTRSAQRADRHGSRKRSRAATARCCRRTRARPRSISRATARCRRSTTRSSRRWRSASSSTSARPTLEAKKEEFKGKPVVAVLERELESIDAELARPGRADRARRSERPTP